MYKLKYLLYIEIFSYCVDVLIFCLKSLRVLEYLFNLFELFFYLYK